MYLCAVHGEHVSNCGPYCTPVNVSEPEAHDGTDAEAEAEAAAEAEAQARLGAGSNVIDSEAEARAHQASQIAKLDTSDVK